MKGRILISILLSACTPITSTSQQANPRKDIFFRQKECPLVSTSPVTGSGLDLKNVGWKPITGYTLACFRRGARKRTADLIFEESVYDVPPNETVGEFGFDATPPNICRCRKTLIGVYEVKFSDGTSWKTTALR